MKVEEDALDHPKKSNSDSAFTNSDNSLHIQELLRFSHNFPAWLKYFHSICDAYNDNHPVLEEIIVEYCKVLRNIFPCLSIVKEVIHFIDSLIVSSGSKFDANIIIESLGVDYIYLIAKKDIVSNHFLSQTNFYSSILKNLPDSYIKDLNNYKDEQHISIYEQFIERMSIKNINEANNLLKYITTHESIDRDQVLMLCFHLLDQVNDNDSLSQFIALYILKFAVQNYNAFQYKLIPYLALKFTNDSACTNHLYWKIFMMINSNQMTEGIILDTLNEAAELCSTDVKNCGEFCINLITHLCNHIDIKSKEKIEDDSFLSQYIDLITKTVEYFVQRLQQFNRCSQYLSRLYIVSLNYLTKWKQINISRTFWGRLLDISESVSDVMLFDYVKFEEAFGDEDQICDSIVYSIDRCTDIMNKKYLLHIFEAKYLMNDPERSKDFRSLHNAFKKCRGKQNDNSKDKKNYETNRESIQPNNPVNSNDFTLFISNLDYLITREEIAEFFKVNAGIEQCEIELKGMKNKIKKHSGFGNVNFLSKSDCEKALALNRLLIGTKQRPIYISKFNQKFQVNKYSEQEESNKVFLQNLPMFITEEELSSHLGTIDSPNSIRIARTRSGKGKGIAYLEFKDEDAAKEAINCLNGKILLDKCIIAQLSNPKKSKDVYRKKKVLSTNEQFRDEFLQSNK